MNQEKVTLGAVTENSVEKSGPAGETFIYIDISSIDRDKKVISEPKTLTTAEAPSRAKQVLKSGDVLVSMTRPNLNQVAIVTPEFHGAIGSTGFHVLRSPWAEPKFLFYLVQSNDFVDEMCKCVQGALYPAVRPKDISSFEFFLPSSLEQQQIVAAIETHFSRLDEAVANLKRVKANLKRYKAAVLKAAVEGKLTEEWRRQHPDAEPADKLLERILTERRKAAGKGKYKEPVAPDTSGLPELPAGWVWASGEQLFEWSSGDFLPASKTMTGEIPVYGGNGISGYHDSANVDCSTIIIGRVGAQCGNVHMSAGRCWVTDNAIFAKKLPESVMQSYASLVFTVANLNKKAAGSGQPFVNQKMLNAIEVPLLPIAEQHQIVAEVERRLSIVAEAEAQVDANLRRADRLRQSILKQAFSGQLVPPDPNDEPASVLLERIRNNVGAIHESPSRVWHKQNRAIHESPLRKQRQPAEPKPATSDFASLDSVLTAILNRMEPGREYSRADLADPLGLTTGRWNAAIQELKRRGLVRQFGERRGARYISGANDNANK